ncbi:TAP-like domain-containing protein [Trichoderma austrokoningii]
MRATVGIAVNGLVGLAAASSKFDWTSITPSEHLEYHDCFDDFQCARLIAPLDYTNASDARTIAIAMIKLPAAVPDHAASFAGAVFTNPGGPGSSGVDLLLRDGKHLRDVLDKPGHRHYEILSFDPRGIGSSWPRANCFARDMLGRDAALLELRGRGPLSGDSALPYVLALQRGIGQRCEDADESGVNGGQILGYMGTPNVARDLVQMVDKVAELRAREARDDDGMELRRRRASPDDDEDVDVPRLQYIGYSYGTVLGNYFASMFPGRVGRLMLDGVVNVQDYSSGPGWLTNLKDTDEMADRFFSDCNLAGPKNCALARDNDTAVKGRFYEWLAKLDEEPLSAVSPSGAVVVISSQDIREMLAQALYTPRDSFRGYAKAVDDAMRGNLSAIVERLFNRHIPRLKDACDVDGGGAEGFFQEAGAGVLCADGDDVSGHDAAWWKRYIRRQTGVSSVYGAYWANIRIACNAWNFNFRPNWVFKGPFTTPPAAAAAAAAAASPLPGHPAAPILFVSNRLDPVTPLAAARAMAAQHPGAGLVIAEALGHCAMGNGDSACLYRHIADYFDTGVVPDGEAVCEADCGPWDEKCDGVGAYAVSREGHGYHREYPLGVF